MCSRNVSLWGRCSQAACTLPLLLALTGCGAHYVSRGSALYEDERYVEAAEVFEKTEQRLHSSSNAERARFGLYRGATYLKLGDAAHAARWLGYARAVVKSEPSALGRADLALLDASLKAVADSKSSEPAPAPDTELATAPRSPEPAQ